MKLLKALLGAVLVIFGVYMLMGLISLAIPSWDTYTYDGEYITVQDDNITSEHDVLIDTSRWEYITTTNCPMKEAIRVTKHNRKKFHYIQQLVESKHYPKKAFCTIHNDTPAEVRFPKIEKEVIPLTWGIELTKKDWDGETHEIIGYIQRQNSSDPVMYHIQDSTETYFGYNNLLYDELLAFLE